MSYKNGLQAWCKRKIWMQRNLNPPLQSHFQEETQPPSPPPSKICDCPRIA